MRFCLFSGNYMTYWQFSKEFDLFPCLAAPFWITGRDQWFFKMWVGLPCFWFGFWNAKFPVLSQSSSCKGFLQQLSAMSLGWNEKRNHSFSLLPNKAETKEEVKGFPLFPFTFPLQFHAVSFWWQANGVIYHLAKQTNKQTQNPAFSHFCRKGDKKRKLMESLFFFFILPLS